MCQAFADAINNAIDRGEQIYAVSPYEYYFGTPLSCDGECFSILCESEEEDGELRASLWTLKIAALTGIRSFEAVWDDQRLDRIILNSTPTPEIAGDDESLPGTAV